MIEFHAIKSREILMLSVAEKRKRTEKLLGAYLVEAGIITSTQLDIALDEQKFTTRRLGEILVNRDWVEQQTIEYFIEKLVLPEQQAIQKNLPHLKKDRFYKRTLVEPCGQLELVGSNSLIPSMPSHRLAFHLSPRQVIRFLLPVILGLVFTSLVGQFTVYFLPDYPARNYLANLFNVNGEMNIPALYSWSALLLCSILLAITTYAKKLAGERYTRHWGALSIIFLYLSLDEAMSIHEQIIGPLRSAMHTSGFLYYAWIIPGGIFVLICLLAFREFLTALPAQIRRLFIIAGIIFVGGAIGMESVGGYYAELYGSRSIMYAILDSIEEFCEMLGIVIFIYGILSYMSYYMKGVGLRVNIIDDRKQLRSI